MTKSVILVISEESHRETAGIKNFDSLSYLQPCHHFVLILLTPNVLSLRLFTERAKTK